MGRSLSASISGYTNLNIIFKLLTDSYNSLQNVALPFSLAMPPLLTIADVDCG